MAKNLLAAVRSTPYGLRAGRYGMREAKQPEHTTQAEERATEAADHPWADLLHGLLQDQLREFKEEAQHLKRAPKPLTPPAGRSPRRQR